MANGELGDMWKPLQRLVQQILMIPERSPQMGLLLIQSVVDAAVDLLNRETVSLVGVIRLMKICLEMMRGRILWITEDKPSKKDIFLPFHVMREATGIVQDIMYEGNRRNTLGEVSSWLRNLLRDPCALRYNQFTVGTGRSDECRIIQTSMP